MPKTTRQLRKIERFLRMPLGVAIIYTIGPLLIGIIGGVLDMLFCRSQNTSPSCSSIQSMTVWPWLFMITGPTGLPVVLGLLILVLVLAARKANQRNRSNGR